MDIQSGRWLTFSLYLSEYRTSSRRRISPNKNNITKSEAGPQNTHADIVDKGVVPPTRHKETNSDTGSSTDQAPVDTTPVQGSQERFDQDVMIYYQGVDDSSLVSQFLNLDDETCVTWPDFNQTTTLSLNSPMIPSTSFTSIPEGDASGWELEPTSLHMIDMKKFETVPDFGDGEKASPWPWGNYTYRPPTPPRYLEPDECIMELEFAAMERMLREELTETMAEEAIRGGREAAKQREPREKKEEGCIETERERPSIVAFNHRVVRGRTIYNP